LVSLFWILGTDEAAIIEVLSSRTSDERQQIKQKYKTKYGKVITGVCQPWLQPSSFLCIPQQKTFLKLY
jgi:3-deoxy-D-arabino-heptulosonate 7-phosphate (DAHP) synthase